MENTPQPSEADSILTVLQSGKPLERTTLLANLFADAEGATRTSSLILEAICHRLWKVKDVSELEEIIRDLSAVQDDFNRRTQFLHSIGKPLFLAVVEQTEKTKPDPQVTVH